MIPLMWRRWAAGATYGALLALAAGTAGCNGADTGSLPTDVVDPATLKTPAGALARYRAARGMMGGVLDGIMTSSGIMTDELASLPAPIGISGVFNAVDARTDLTSLATPNWTRLHRLRAQAREARGFLAAYLPDSSPALQGSTFAYEAYADVFLADLFCSGIPLSTVDFDGGYTLAPGSATSEVYQRAVGLFDSALAISSDSVNILHLAAVGKARALLALGQYADAAAAVTGVPDDYVTYVRFDHPTDFTSAIGAVTGADSAYLWFFASKFRSNGGVPSIANNEGTNGLDYRSSGDPRSSFTKLDGADPNGNTMYFPAKYALDLGIPGLPRFVNAPDSFIVASGIEARLIEAEAALQSGGDWLAILNHLRQAAWPMIAADTVSDPWVSGPGPLPDLSDPGTASGRVDLLFRERAFWLFLTGHRQGDLRRLIRQYQRLPDHVYPTGIYAGGGGIATYGSEVVVAPPATESKFNPAYAGCIDHNP